MYVRKFEAETIDDALKLIKRELGPDAIILKTTTNRGLKGAFKKKVEVTAAISEENYSKKMKVDHVLDDKQKDSFYSDNSQSISKMMNQHSKTTSVKSVSQGYGKAGLNRSVQSATETASSKNSVNDLDSFLSDNKIDHSSNEKHSTPVREFISDVTPEPLITSITPITKNEPQADQNTLEIINDLVGKLENLQRNYHDLKSELKSVHKNWGAGISQMRVNLKTLGIDDEYIEILTKKVIFELDSNEQENYDQVYEFCLKEMIPNIKTALPMFSKIDSEVEQPAVSVCVSDTSVGQSTLIQKIACMKKDSVIIRVNYNQSLLEKSLAEKVYGLDVYYANSIAEVISYSRKAIENNKFVFVDYKDNTHDNSESIKKLNDSLRRSFSNVEVMICLSAIHSEMYNRKVVEKYGSFSNGLAFTRLDQCVNFGSIFNLGIQYPKLPLKLFGTGMMIPDDIENASADRILASIFNLM